MDGYGVGERKTLEMCYQSNFSTMANFAPIKTLPIKEMKAYVNFYSTIWKFR